MKTKRIVLRKALRSFAKNCEIILKENDYKGGWKELTLRNKFNKLVQEVFELHTKFIKRDCKISTDSEEQIKRECCDIANFAMMIHDELTEDIGK